MPTSVRLDAKSEALLRKLARQSGRTKSHVLRDAIARLAEDDESLQTDQSVFALASDLVGAARGGPVPNLARRHKSIYAEALRRKHAR